MRRAIVLGLGIATLACKGAGEPSEPIAERPIAAPELEPAREPEASAEPEPAAEPGDADAPQGFVPATRGSGNCEVTVSALLEAEEYRGGGPMTPALEASLAADPDFARMYNSESHGDHHIQCVFQIELAHEPGKRYRWRTWFSNTLRDKTTEHCDAIAAEVAEDVIRTTKNCTDPTAGAYWGHTLDPA